MKVSVSSLLMGFFGLVLSTLVAAEGMSVTPQEAHALVTGSREDVLFLDVRDPVEIMFVGFTDAVDLNIPYLLVDRSQWDEQKNRFRVYRNPEFLTQVEQALARRGLGREATIITLCRSGSERGLPSAQFLRDQGFPNAVYVEHGFQGDKIKEGERAGFRLLNGWQNSGLPWSTSPNPDKIHRLDR